MDAIKTSQKTAKDYHTVDEDEKPNHVNQFFPSENVSLNSFDDFKCIKKIDDRPKICEESDEGSLGLDKLRVTEKECSQKVN